MKKIIGAIFAILLIFICINCVNAEDLNLTDVNSSVNDTFSSDLLVDDSLIENTSHNHAQVSNLTGPVLNAVIAPGGTFADFQSLVNSASAGSVIDVTGDYTNTNGAYIYISKSLTINGNGHIFDALNKTRVFYVVASLSIDNLTLMNGHADYMSNTNLNPRAKYGGYYPGGGIFSTAYLSVTNCNFLYNLGGDSATASDIQTQNHLYIANCTFMSYFGTSISVIPSHGGKYTYNAYIYDSTFQNLYLGGGTVLFSEMFGSPTNIMHNCAILNTSVFSYISGNWRPIDYQNLWFGTNNPIDVRYCYYNSGGYEYFPDNWVVMNFTNDNDFSSSGGTVSLTTSLDWIYNHTSNAYEKLATPFSLPRTVTYNSSIGTVSPSSSSISGVSSASYTYPATSNLTITATIDNQVLYIKNPLTTGTFKDLQRLIDNTTVGDTLVLTKDYYYDPARDLPYTHGMYLNKTITIKGNGHIISGIDKARIFQVTGSNINLQNITFENGYAINTMGDGNYRGGAIFSTGNYLNVSNCTFRDNYAPTYAGAIDQYSNTIIIENCNFFNNTAGEYGAVVIDSTVSTNTITGSLFENNTGSTYGSLYLGNGVVNYNAFIETTSSRSIYRYNGNLEYNWWGSNNPSLSTLIQGSAPSTRFIMNFTNITPISYSAGSSTLKTNLNTIYNSGTGSYSTLTSSPLPARTVKYESTYGSISPYITSIDESNTTTFTHPANMGEWLANATIDYQTLWIGSLDLGINITPSVDPVADGGNITYTIAVVNRGPMNASFVNVSLFLPNNVLNITNFTNNTGSFNISTGEWYIGELNVGNTVYLVIKGTVLDPGKYLVWNATVNDGGGYEHSYTSCRFRNT